MHLVPSRAASAIFCSLLAATAPSRAHASASGAHAEGDATTIAAAVARGARHLVISASRGALEVRRAPAQYADAPSGDVLAHIADGHQVDLAFAQGHVTLGGKTVDGPGVSIAGVGAGARLRLHGREWPDRLDVVVDDGALMVVNYAPLEAYVTGVVAGEMPNDWPVDALRAQAVASRSYALFQKMNHPKGARYDVEISVTSQVYVGGRVPQPVRDAVASTRGEVLTVDRQPINALFHACCGGHTASATDLWQGSEALPYLESVACGFDSDSPLASPWTRKLALSQVTWRLHKAGLLPKGTSRVTAVRVTGATDQGRALDVELETHGGGNRKLRADELRSALGYEFLPSNLFTLTVDDGDLVADGRGSGHGAGMCQWGAHGMAEAGKSYRQILAHYYPDTALRKVY